MIKIIIFHKSQILCETYGGHFVFGDFQGHGHILQPGNLFFLNRTTKLPYLQVAYEKNKILKQMSN